MGVRQRLARLGRFASLEARKLGLSLRRGEYGVAAGSLAELATGSNPYYERAVDGGDRDDRYRRVDLEHGTLLVDADDAGISRTLLAYGVHEYLSTTRFERELERLRATTNGPVTVLDVGANVGYFCLLSAAVLGERARIHAVEPVPDNVALLEHNVSANGYGDAVSIDRCAFGARTEPVAVELSTHSNHHRVTPSAGAATEASAAASGADATDTGATPPETAADGGDREAPAVRDDRRGRDGDRLLVEQVTGERFLADRDVDPSAVRVVRTDVEGYEREVFEGLRPVFEAAGPRLVHVELHPLELSEDGIDDVVGTLEGNGFEVVSAVRTEAAAGVSDGRRWRGIDLDLEGFPALRREMADCDHSIELIARK